MTEKEAEKYLGTAELAMQDKDYEDAKKYILKSLNLKTTEKGYKMLNACEAKLKEEKDHNSPQNLNSKPQNDNGNCNVKKEEPKIDQPINNTESEQANNGNKEAKAEEKAECTDEEKA